MIITVGAAGFECNLDSSQNSDEDTIDCVKLVDQPAFDHLLLKNHTIRLAPTFVSEWGNQNDGGQKAITQLWHFSGSCPDGTIPIRRSTKREIQKKTSYTNKNVSTDLQPLDQAAIEVALGYTTGDNYLGTSANLNIWSPHVEGEGEYSKTQVGVVGANNDVVVDAIEAGWHVDPRIYGDDLPRIYAFWTNDGYKTGCFNLDCPGFVQVSTKILLGGTFEHVSSYGHELFTMRVLIRKDPKDGNWWLANPVENVGYWPNSLFSTLQQGALMYQWGGEVRSLNPDFKHTTTQMGSGHFSSEDYGRASLISNIKLVHQSGGEINPSVIQTKATRPECYDIKDASFDKTPYLGKHFYYGGPGRNDNCP
ncbi:hypothetical protein ACFE04_010185 [Oxalis oulophora]